MKSIKIVIAFVLGVVVSGIGVYALSINSKDVSYKTTNVSDALDDLYEKAGNVGSGIGDPLIPVMSSNSQDGITISSSGDKTPVLNAFDGDDSTQWTTTNRYDQYVQVDLGEEKSLRKIEFLTRSYNGTDTSHYVQVSNDGTNWENASLSFVHRATSPTWYYFYLNHDARYIRLYISGYVDIFGIYSIQVYGY